MSIGKLFSRPIAFHRPLVELTGGILPALMLSQAIYWTPRTKDNDGWFWKTREQWQDETGMTRREQETARKKLRAATVDGDPIWFEELRGMPGKLHYRINEEALTVWASGMLGASVPTRMAHPYQQEGTDRANNSIYTETTSKTTNRDYKHLPTLDDTPVQPNPPEQQVGRSTGPPTPVGLLTDSFVGLQLNQARKYQRIDPELVARHVFEWERDMRSGKVNSVGALVARLNKADSWRVPELSHDDRSHPYYVRHFGQYDFRAAESRENRDYMPATITEDASRMEYAA